MLRSRNGPNPASDRGAPMLRAQAMPAKTTMNKEKRAKLKTLVHYVIAKAHTSRLGSVRLNKILWYVDTISYRTTGESVTGETYVKQPRGPVAKHLPAILGELEHSGAIAIRTGYRFRHPMRDYIALKDPSTLSLKKMSKADLDLADEIREVICEEHTANSISELSHDLIWETANMGEVIPMSASLASIPGEVTHEMLKWAESVRTRYEKVTHA